MLNRMTLGDRIFVIIAYILVGIVALACLYPFVYVVSASMSDFEHLGRGEVWLLPKGINFEAYKIVLQTDEIWTAYGNTLWYVVVGTLVSLFLSTITAYPLSRQTFGGRRFLTLLFSFTMFFGGGLIPTYLVVKNLGLIDKRWALVIPSAISTWNIIIMRTFFQNIPESLTEAATIDGCNDIHILVRIILPLSMPIISVMVLFYAVGQWNSYFNAIIYLNNYELYPLQVILRKILIQHDASDMKNFTSDQDKMREVALNIRYATIVVSTLPILCIYPFLQKYFVQGIMIGAIKG